MKEGCEIKMASIKEDKRSKLQKREKISLQFLL